MSQRPKTVGELRASGWRSCSIRDEMRRNLQHKLRQGETLFPGVLGYDRTVIPGIVNALLAGHDFILLGLRGQAKTRLLRQLTGLLDDYLPVLADSELNDDPFDPISVPGQRSIAEAGDQALIDWLPRELRYHEKLATPDVTISDLLGDIDPIKAATRRLTYADPEVIHFGIVPRTNRGIFAINELPDLAPRIQVGLLNILEERDLQIRGFPVRLPLDMLLVFSANPEDYTNRGSIITPLKDRISSQILTHYPADAMIAAQVSGQEAWLERGSEAVVIPATVRLLIEEISIAARHSELIDQTSGVSARLAISALELLCSNLERRALITGDNAVHPRICDLHMLLPAITGKVEMVYEGEQQGTEVVAKKLVGEAVKKAFEKEFPEVGSEVGREADAAQRSEKPDPGSDNVGPYASIIGWFAAGNVVTLTDEQPFADYRSELERVPGLFDLVRRNVVDRAPESEAWLAELVLEGLHQHLKLAREDLDSQIHYKEMVKFQLLKSRRQRRDRDVN